MKHLLIISIFFISCGNRNESTLPSKENADTVSTRKDSLVINSSIYDRKNFSVLDSALGDLNLDAYPDKILVLKNKTEDIEGNVARPLLILKGLPNESFKLAERNDSVVLCANCGGIFGDPYEGITIKNGYFSIEHYGGSAWRWTRIITFKYSKAMDTWILHTDAGISYHTSDPDKTEDIITNLEDFDKLSFKEYKNMKGF